MCSEHPGQSKPASKGYWMCYFNPEAVCHHAACFLPAACFYTVKTPRCRQQGVAARQLSSGFLEQSSLRGYRSKPKPGETVSIPVPLPTSSVEYFPLTPKELRFPALRCAEGTSGLLKCSPKIPVELTWHSKGASAGEGTATCLQQA